MSVKDKRKKSVTADLYRRGDQEALAGPFFFFLRSGGRLFFLQFADVGEDAVQFLFEERIDVAFLLFRIQLVKGDEDAGIVDVGKLVVDAGPQLNHGRGQVHV